MKFPWKQMDDGVVWFRHGDTTFRQVHLEEVTLHPTFGLHYMRAMREANLLPGSGIHRLGQYGQRLHPPGWRFWFESKWYGPSLARFRYRQRTGLSSVNPEVIKHAGYEGL